MTNATDFKAHCLKLIDEVSRTGKPVVITKHGKIVAKLVRAGPDDAVDPMLRLRGTVRIVGDIISPTTSPDDWDAERGVL